MSNVLRRLRHDERGMSFVFVGMGFMAFLAATTLAIDVGMFMNARSQAQNAADAGALAGATALYFDDFNDRSAGGPAVQNGIVTATDTNNRVMGYAASVTPPDVTFPNDPNGQPTRVRVNVFRNADRGNPVTTLMGVYFGVSTVNITAMATAEVSPANAQTCVKPFTIPDKWIENQTPPWDPDDTFDTVDNKNNPLPNPDTYTLGVTSYSAELPPSGDRGTELMIRAGTGNEVNPSFYFSWAMPVGTGADWYTENIANCNTTIMYSGDLLTAEPGNMVGPTNQGIDILIAKDPLAYWDTVTKKVVSSQTPSARIIAIPLFDPVYYDIGKQNGRDADLKLANWLGFFVDRRVGNNVYGYITPISGIFDGNAGPAPPGLFPKVIRLVE